MKHRPALKTLMLASGLLGILGYGTNASADPVDPIFNFTFSIGPNTGFGSLEAVDNSANTPGSFWATSGALTVTGGSDVGSYLLFPGGPGFTWSPADAFTYDNLLFPGTNPSIDNNGLLFADAGLEINIWSTPENNPDNPPFDFSFFSCSTIGTIVHPSDCVSGNDLQADQIVGSTFSVSAVPEPATLFLLGAGLLGFSVLRRRRKGCSVFEL